MICLSISCSGRIRQRIAERREGLSEYKPTEVNEPPAGETGEATEEPGEPFGYESAPINVTMVPFQGEQGRSDLLLSNNYDLYSFEYPSDGQDVPALFAMPTQGGLPLPVVLLLHGHRSSKDYMIQRYSRRLAVDGVASVAIDLPLEGERSVEGRNFFSGDPKTTAQNIKRAVIDCRRALDWLSSQQNVDLDEIAIIGYSLGSWIGARTTAADQRVDAVALNVMGVGEPGAIAGPWPSFLEEHPTLERLLGQGGTDLSAPEFSGLLIERWVGTISPRPLLMLNGRNDPIVTEQNAQKLFDAAGEPKEIYWYDSGHILPPQATEDCVKWAVDKLTPG
jgi:hypothetical protein